MTIDWLTKVITTDRTVDAWFTLESGSIYTMDTDAFRLALKDVEDDEDGMVHDDTHRHNTEVVLSGVTYARTFEIINGYTVELLPDSSWSAKLTGSNNNLADVKVVNQVSLIQQNSGGLVVAAGADAVWDELMETGYTARETVRIMAAALAGKLSGADTTNIKVRDLNDTKDRIDATVTAEGNRSSVTLDGS